MHKAMETDRLIFQDNLDLEMSEPASTMTGKTSYVAATDRSKLALWEGSEYSPFASRTPGTQ